MFGWLQKLREAREWRLVATFEASYTDSSGKSRTRIFYYLKESGAGRRECVYESHGPYSGEGDNHPFYLKKIKPWLMGAYDPDIPSFYTIKAKEFKDALKGQKT